MIQSLTRRAWKFLLILFVIPFFNSCYYDNLEEIHPNANINCVDTTGTISYTNDIVPILTGSCGLTNSSCHNGSTQFPMDTYTGVAAQAANGNLVKAVIHDPTVSAMPKDGGMLNTCYIKEIQAWVNRGFPQN
jgi:hypothetical protein